ncbi:hypothetical protein SCACP_01190 [Sporomusa carbonis]|uniref:alpha/beta hydrolase n=1 Tax=Sporomusa carbonis TaxID=3076075 RepID=UPI003A5F8E8F
MDAALKAHKRKIYVHTAKGVFLLIILIINFICFFIGAVFHNEFCVLNTRTSFVRYNRLQARLEQGLRTGGWQTVSLYSRFGYILKGTFLPNPVPSDKTVIFVHGIAANQLMGLPYSEMYLDKGYNILIYDSRAHGESGGSCTTWGYYEKYDLDQWVDWLEKKYPNGVIGVHGVSMGAATALMHASLNEPSKRVKFYIADSAYSDLEDLLTQQITALVKSRYPLWVLTLIKYCSVVAYIQSRFSYADVSPLRAVSHVTTPVLYLHGESDTLVPAGMSVQLYAATKGYREIHIFPNVKHGMAILDRRYEYQETVTHFLNSIPE